jgi:hypothetical protein
MFEARLAEDLKDPEFRRGYEEAGREIKAHRWAERVCDTTVPYRESRFAPYIGVGFELLERFIWWFCERIDHRICHTYWGQRLFSWLAERATA